MKTARNTFVGSLLGLRATFHRNGAGQRCSTDAAPLRSELFSADQMERHGRTLAASHKLAGARGRDQLLARLVENEGVLVGACKLLMSAVTDPRESVFAPLTTREVEILDCIARGNSNKEIARILNISDQTVKNHITSILRKLAVNDRTQAVIYALRHGWIKMSDE